MSSVFIFAGEVSADKLGGAILHELNSRDNSCAYWGVGGEAMLKENFESIRALEDFTVLGLSEAFSSMLRLRSEAKSLVKEILKKRPQVILTIDSKGFSFYLGRQLKKAMKKSGWHAPIIHLVAPTVWAWGSWRAKRVAKSVDCLLCFFPFEEKYFSNLNLEVDVVGHPSAWHELPSKKQARKDLGISADAPLLVLLPGSRKREVETLLPDMCGAVKILRKEFSNLKTVMPMVSGLLPLSNSIVKETGVEINFVKQDEVTTALAAGDYALMSSGTITLEAALAGIDGSAYYRLDFVSSIVGKLLVKRKNVVLPNAILGKEVYPFYFNNEFSSKTMANNVSNHFTKTHAPKNNFASQLNKQLKIGKSFASNIADVISSCQK